MQILEEKSGESEENYDHTDLTSSCQKENVLSERNRDKPLLAKVAVFIQELSFGSDNQPTPRELFKDANCSFCNSTDRNSNSSARNSTLNNLSAEEGRVENRLNAFLERVQSTPQFEEDLEGSK